MNENQHSSPNEARIAALVRATGVDAPPPDAAVLAQLRERALAVLEEESGAGVSPAVGNNEKAGQAGGLSYGRSLMFRVLIALAAAIVIGVFAFNPWTTTPVNGAPFAQVLKNLRDAQSLRLQVLRDNQQAQVWISRPGLVRYEESPERYQVAAGSRWWKVDESTNSVTTGDSPWFRSPEQQVDLLELLDLGVRDSQPLMRTRPSERRDLDGQQCVVYRSTLNGKRGPVEIEAFADSATGQLTAILARKPDGPRTGAPLAELKLLAVNEVVDEKKFAIAKTLTEDGRIGKVVEAQGIVVLRPMLAKRWTPICTETLLKPGDWLRTEIRGANAAKTVLSSDVEITLGPGSLLEFVSPTEARLHSGQAQVNVEKKDVAFTLLAPRTGSEKFAEGKQIVRVDREEKLVKFEQQPLWLKGFEGTANNESLGSLIVQVDGRAEPLTVGYHKVSVEIRDQIARTTIEESFVNHTDTRLEGVFHFPLPQDASISGFGMWIGNDLIEADVVEKQRAREIYETILRERRDPGLLEWTSGNLFKARVFPIEPNSEKRVKIVYTQVLPLRGNRYRYNYALRSDLLQTKPLRELSLNVTVNSALALKSVSCPTHSARTQQTAHSAQVDFSAQEYTPTRDFELVCEVDGKQADVVAIFHRRGDDGYFLLQLMPPSGEGDFQREVLPEGEALNLILLCDTSASMDSEKRRQQAEFVAAALLSLGEKDRFNIVAADVGTAWCFAESMPATAENAGKARAFLDDRLSLGWTNLERAFEDVLKKSPAGANVVYIGDGIVSTGETDPSSFVKRLGQFIADKGGDVKRTFHAVTVGNTHEAIVLKGIASVAGGSVRGVSGEQTPQKVALELLNELAQPGLRDLNLEFRGVKVAALYPGKLPNLAAGTQQILVGRYLPQGSDQQGKVIVTGMKGKEEVRYEATIALKDAEEGNSFIPRLWARAHLDHLLAQGQSQATQDEIIALSEKFHIITPYTSLLVLETDADRERFGVKRRYEMRDGERFFAEGKANANYELLQQQMKRAGDWRLALRRQTLRQLATLGRNQQIFQRQVDVLKRAEFERLDDYRIVSSTGAMNGPWGGGGASGPMADFDTLIDLITTTTSPDTWSDNGGSGSISGFPTNLSLVVSQTQDVLELGDAEEDLKLSEDVAEKREKSSDAWDVDGEEGYLFNDLDDGISRKKLMAYDPQSADTTVNLMGMGFKDGGGFGRVGRRYYGHYRQYVDYTAWVKMLFPALAAPTKEPVPAKDPQHWPPEAIALSKSLLRKQWLDEFKGSFELRRVTDTFDPSWERRSSHNADIALYSREAWVVHTLDPEDAMVVEFANAKERGIYNRALLLGRIRKSVKQDLLAAPLGLDYYTTAPLHLSQRYYQARVEKAGENQVRLILTNKEGTSELRYTIDTARHVILKLEQFQDGKPSSSTTYSDFVEIGGAWFAGKNVIRDAEDRKLGETTYSFKSLADGEFQKRVDAELAARPQVQFLSQPLPKLKVARQKVADGAADFNERMVMILHFCQLQQWDEVLKQVDALEKLTEGKPGVRWIRTMLLETMRRNDEARQRLLDEAKKLAAGKSDDEIALADFILGRASQVCGGSELKEFVDVLKPVYERQPAKLNVLPRWENYLLNVYESLNKKEESLALRQNIAERSPWEAYQQTHLAMYLSQAGRPEEAVAWLQKAIGRPEKRTAYEDEVLRAALAEQYRNQGRWDELLKFTTEWIARKPEYSSACAQHLAALVYNEQLDAANSLAEQWLKESRVERKLATDERARLDAAIGWAQGSSQNISFQRMDPRWQQPLAETARFFLRHKHHFDIVQRIFSYRFAETDAADQVRGYFLAILQAEVATLPPDRIGFLVSHTLTSRLEVAEPINGRKQLLGSEVPLDVWKKIAGVLRERWSQEKDVEAKYQLGEALKSIYASRFYDSEHLPFLRERVATATFEYLRIYHQELFDSLLGRNWDDKLEAEAFELLNKLPDTEVVADRLLIQVPALYRLVDAMIANRITAAEKQLHDSGEQTKLTRPALAKKKAELRKAAQTGVADRLAALAKDEKNPLWPWLRIEQAWLDVRLDRNLPQAEELCWKLLDVAPPKPADAEEELEPAVAAQRFLNRALQHRALSTAMNLAARKNAKPESVDRVLKYLDAGIAQGGDAATAWRMTKFSLLLALDRADDLERQLREWVRTEESTAPWRIMLGILVAERGKLDEAIQLFEAADKQKLLAADHWRMLSDWYLVVDRRQAYERARIEAYKQMPEHQLGNLVYRLRQPWYYTDRPLPSELDENTLFVFKALFEKSSQPEQYFYHLRDLYAACRDFRLLQMLPDTVLGRSPQQIYGILNGIRSYVLYELRNEATADEIMARIRSLREGERTSTDLRALDLLEAIIERQSSEVPNQAGPHAKACLAALKRAFEREWGEGEPRAMAQFLHQLGTLHDPQLVAEQIRELRALQKMTKAETREHLYITHYLALVLFDDYHKHDEAIQEMQAEYAAWLRVNNGQWPYEDLQILEAYVHLYEKANRHAAGETVLQKQLKADNAEVRKWTEARVLQLYRLALEAKTEVSLGSGGRLLASAVDLGLRYLQASPDENYTRNLTDRVIELFEAAHSHEVPGRQAKLQTFAFETVPQLLKQQRNQYHHVATRPVDVIQKTLGHKVALQYVVEGLEQYPTWLEISGNRGWNVFGSQLAYQRHSAEQSKEDIEALEPRVLKLAITELKRYLREMEGYNHSEIYYIHSTHFWTAKKGDFLKAAEEVYAERKPSGRAVMFIAQYLFTGLNLPARAIEVLLVANEAGILDEEGQLRLVEFLHSEKRYAESIPILQKLIERRPDVIQHRTRLMVAYFHSKRLEQLRELLAQTDEHFRKEGRWVERNIAELATACNGTELYPQAVAYFNEAISQRQRHHNGVTLGDTTLSSWYQGLSQAHNFLGQTKEAVDAASAAVVCWSPQQREREYALNALHAALNQSPDLDAYVKQHDAETEKSGQDSPLLRKMIGRVYKEKGKHAEALKNLQLAVTLQPNDKEVHQWLIATYDALGQREEGTKQLLRQIDFDRHDLGLYTTLAERLKDNEAEAQRAASSIIEAAPTEAENHAAYAELMQTRNRWDEAIPHWQQVAEFRRLEPTGLLKLAAAQIHEKQWPEARQTVKKLQQTAWPARFDKVDQETRQLQEQLPRK